MSQQLAINVINYASTLVTSERYADVECAYGAFSALQGLSQTCSGNRKWDSVEKNQKGDRDNNDLLPAKRSERLLFLQRLEGNHTAYGRLLKAAVEFLSVSPLVQCRFV